MAEEAILVVSIQVRRGGSRMSAKRPIMGAASGLLLAAVIILGVSFAGGGAAHLDLKANSQSSTAAFSTQSVENGGTSVTPQTGVQTTESSSQSASSPPVSSLEGLENHGGGTIGLLLLPILLGALLGAVFYGAYTRRVDTE
jgi:hypothetical protein